ncbi:MAG TPA: hypothetical protein VNM40_00990 [Candidatus Paceibacterota bacterium]|nr:hypothetical protein [Candidatus Paceibacterota bacterium]
MKAYIPQWMRTLADQVREPYRALFSIRELEENRTVQWMFGAMLFFFFLTFSKWISSHAITLQTAYNGTALCWPYFQECAQLYFLETLPYGYSQSTLYMALYGVMAAIVYAMWKRDWMLAHALMLPLFLWKVFVVFVLHYTIAGPYDYYHLILTAALLFIPHKEYFLKLLFVLLYFLSATTKFDASWTLGTYFSTLQTGLPLFPDSLIPLFTNLVIFMQVVGAWFLLSSRMRLQRTALVFFAAFHLYSGILVYYHYPSIALPALLILFGPLYRYTRPPCSRRVIAGWLLVFAVILFELPPAFIDGDRRLTLEGNRFGMFMFEANHQCVIRTTEYGNDERARAVQNVTAAPRSCISQRCLASRRVFEERGTPVIEETWEIAAAWNRCDPYVELKRIQGRCVESDRIALTLDHSVSGGPFYRIVDVEDACVLTYDAFRHNDWITMPPEAPVLGYPLKDEYRY